MRTRRLVGFLTMLVMLHLMVGSASACMTHERGGGMAQMHGGAESEVTAMHASDHGDPRTPCDATSDAHCCDAMAGCGAIVAPSVATREGAAVRLAVVIPTSTTEHLLSRASGPEPPPPRA